MSFNRRDFLRAGVIGSAGWALPSSTAAAPAAARERDDRGAARNVIFLVSDGMSLGTLVLAERYRQHEAGRSTHWVGLYGRPDVRRALMDTASADSLVTDSSAASSAWGCGHRVNNAALNVSPDGRRQTPVMHLAAEAGFATGLVTTATVTHATPAGFAACSADRNDEGTIAEQYLAARIDVLLGGGAQFFDPARRGDRLDLYRDYARAGYTIVRDAASLGAAPAIGPLLGTFADSHLPYELDRRADAALSTSVPALADMTRTALARLASGRRGFVLQVEGARVDHAAHANDIGGLVFDQLAFDDALGVVLEFAAGRSDTLVIVTSDHGNANPGLNGVGPNYRDTDACFARLARLRRTTTWALGSLNARSTAAEVRERVRDATDVDLPPDDADLMCRVLRREHRDSYRVRSAPPIALAQVLANHLSIGWTGVSHTSDMTELAAFGPGTAAISGVVPNTALFDVMTSALDLPAPRRRGAQPAA